MIEVKNLTKRYGGNTAAVDDISFNVNAGEILGFLGPNGAGKTTTMNILTGYISATSGECVINGFDVLANPEEAKACIGYLPENPPLYGDMTVLEYLNFVADIKKVKKSQKAEMVRDIMKIVKITDMQKRLTKNLSKGYRQRVGLAQAMMGYPAVMILDEPTVGLDPTQIIEIRDVIRKLSKNHTIILSSHILTEVSAMCDRVMIINRGKIVASDTTEKLSDNLTAGHVISVRVKAGQEEAIAALGQISMAREVRFESSREPGTVDITVRGQEDIDIRESVFNCLAKNQMPILMMKSHDLTLEDIFLKVITGEGGSGK